MAEFQISKDQLKKLIHRDCELFFSFYLGEELTLDIPEFHKEIWDEILELLERISDPAMLTGTLNKLLGVPREHSKTTIIKLACVLFLRYSRLSFLAYISNTFGTALNAVKDIHAWFKSSQDQELYGPFVHEKASEQSGEYLFTIMTPYSDRPKAIIMKAFGVVTQIRGTVIKNKRPDLMVFDDVESRETADSPQLQLKLDTWCMGTAMKSMAKLGLVIFIGNMMADTTLLARLSKEPEWGAVVFGSIIRGADGQLKPLWGPSANYDPNEPSTHGRWTLNALLEDYAKFRRLGTGHVWESEMMNLTAKDILGDSLARAIRRVMPNPEEIEMGFITLDPAFGDKSWHDESALTVHVQLHGDQIPHVIDGRHGRWNEDQILDNLLDLSYRWGLATWMIESVAAQKLLISVFRLTLTVRGMSPETFLMLPLLAGKESKASRIWAFRSAVAVGSYGIGEDCVEIFDRVDAFTPGVEHDDIEDSASMGLLGWAQHGQLVKSQGRQDVVGRLFAQHGTGAPTSGTQMGW